MRDYASVVAGIQSRKEQKRHNIEMEKISRMAQESMALSTKAQVARGEEASERAEKTHELEKERFGIEKKAQSTAKTMSEAREKYIGSLTDYTEAQEYVLAEKWIEEKKRQSNALRASGIELDIAGMKMSALTKLQKEDPERYRKIILEEKAGEDFDQALGIMKLQLDAMGTQIQIDQYKDAQQAQQLSAYKGFMALLMTPGGEGDRLMRKTVGDEATDAFYDASVGGYLQLSGLLDTVPTRTRDEVLKELGYERKARPEEKVEKAEKAPVKRKTRPKEIEAPVEEAPVEGNIDEEAQTYGIDPIKMRQDYPELSRILETVTDPAHLAAILKAIARKMPEENVLKILRGGKDEE